jgi:hypothetical protein
MKKFSVEIKWGIIFTLFTLIWMIFERILGWHDNYIDKHAILTNLYAIPAIILVVLALRDKRTKVFDGKMTWKQGFLTGLGMTVVIVLLSPLSMWITMEFITPYYFENVKSFSIESGKLTQAQAEQIFNMGSYVIQSTIVAAIMGTVTSAIVAFFTKKS